MKVVQCVMVGMLALGLLGAGLPGESASGKLIHALSGNIYYISENGTGTNCSYALPCPTSTGMSKLLPGDTLAIKGTLAGAVHFSKSGTAANWITIAGGTIAAPHTAQDALLVTGSYLHFSNLEVTGGLSFGMRVKGHDIKLSNVSVHDSVWENRKGDACKSNQTSGWGRALTFAPTSYNIEVAGGTVYNNCGEGVGFTYSRGAYLHGMRIYDNFSRNVYISDATGTTVEGITSYYSNPRFYRDGKPGRCIGLGMEAEYFPTYGNMMRDTVIRGNMLSDCGSINYYTEVPQQLPTNVLVENNFFARMPYPVVNIPGTNIVVQNNVMTGSDPMTPVTAPMTTTPFPLPTGTGSATPSSTTTISPTGTFTAAPSSTAASLPTQTFTAMPAITAVIVMTETLTAMPGFTATILPTATFTAMPGSTVVILPTETFTATPGGTDTAIASQTFTPAPGATLTGTFTAAPGMTAVILPTEASATTATSTASATSTATETATATATATHTATVTPSMTPTRTPLAPAGTYDDLHSGFSYGPGWINILSQWAYGGSYHQATANGAVLMFRFTGQSFSVISKGGPTYRLVDVYVDGVLAGTINQQRILSTYNLRWDYPAALLPGEHTLLLQFRTTSADTRGSIDALVVR